MNLAVSLQYGTAQGIVPLQKFLKEFATKVYKPGYEDFTTLIQTGNTDAWSRTVLTLCNAGEMILTEEWTYPSAVASSRPYGIEPVPIAMDGEGMRADDLYKTLAEWDESVRGAPRYVISHENVFIGLQYHKAPCNVHCPSWSEP